MKDCNLDDVFPPEQRRQLFEEVAYAITAALPRFSMRRWRDCIQISETVPDEEGITVLLTPEAMELRLPVTDWPHPHEPVETTRLWQRVELQELALDDLAGLLQAARDAQTAALKRCAHCGQLFPPGRVMTIDGRVCCHGCAERNEGVVF